MKPTRDERRAWRADFKARGVENVRRMVMASNFAPEKHAEAERWLRWEDTRYKRITLIFTAVGAVVGILGVVVALVK